MSRFEFAKTLLAHNSSFPELLAQLQAKTCHILDLPDDSPARKNDLHNKDLATTPQSKDAQLDAAREVVKNVFAQAINNDAIEPAPFFIEGLTLKALASLAKHGTTRAIRKTAATLAMPGAKQRKLIKPVLIQPDEPIFTSDSFTSPHTTQKSAALATRFTTFLLEKHGPEQFQSFATQASAPAVDLDTLSRDIFQKPQAVLEHEFREFLFQSHANAMSFADFARRTATYSKDCKWIWATLTLALVVQIAYAITVPLSMSHLIDVGMNAKDSAIINYILTLLVVMFLFNALATLTQDVTTARIGARIMYRLRETFFAKIIGLSDSSTNRMKAGGFVSRFSSDMGVVEQAMSRAIPGTVKGIIGVTLNVGLLFWVEWKLALITFCILPITVILPKLPTNRARAANAARQDVEGGLVAFVQETVDMFKITRAFGLGDRQKQRFEVEAKNLEAATFTGNAWRFIAGRLTDIGVSFVTLTVICAGSLFAYHGELTSGEFAAFIGLLVNFGAYMRTLGEQVPYLIQGSTGLARIDEVLDDAQDKRSGSKPATFERDIALHDIIFSYIGERPNLDGVSLKIAANSSIAFVGDSGSGKSTTVNLLMRFFDPDSGTITMDGVNIKDIDLAQLRSKIALVPQDSILFDTTIRENIRMGRLDATDQDVKAAAQAAEAHDLIMQLPEGYDSKTGHLGENLSGGQRQRIAIARALVRAPKILILDEATSALDAATAAAIDDTVARLSKGRTVIRVTHRLAAIAQSDTIFVMHLGKVVQRGTHNQLLKQSGIYGDLWDRQHEAEATPLQPKTPKPLVAAE